MKNHKRRILLYMRILCFAGLIWLIAALTGGANATDYFAAIWQKTAGPPWVARHGLNSVLYEQEFEKYASQGMRLRIVDGYESNGRALYATLWEKSLSPHWIARHSLTVPEYQQEFDKQVRNGLRLVWVDGYTINDTEYFAAIWDKSSGPAWVARHGMTSDQYQTEFDRLADDGFRLRIVSGYQADGEARFAALWEQDPDGKWVARHGMSASQYQQEFDALIGKGYRLIFVDGYRLNETDYYAAIWDKSPGPAWVARHGMTSSQYQAEFNKFIGKGYRLKQVSAY
jgi:hypothetical protein